jgi:hypothetical protein
MLVFFVQVGPMLVSCCPLQGSSLNWKQGCCVGLAAQYKMIEGHSAQL